MTKIFVIFSVSFFLGNLFSCQNIDSVSPSSSLSKKVPTETELTDMILSTNEFKDLGDTQYVINSKLPAIIHNATPDFINRYTSVRSKYSSLSSIATTQKIGDQAKFALLLEELMQPVRELNQKREEQFNAIYTKISAKYEVSNDIVFKATLKLLSSLSTANARVSCESTARANGNAVAGAAIMMGYGLGFASYIADIVYQDSLDQCLGGGTAWC